MAVYRQIHVSFWQDEYILDLEPQEKYFYLYLMTNSKTTQCGIYELPKKLMVLELGYPMDTLSILLQKFIDTGKVMYSEDTREIFLLNWLRHNSIKSPKVMSCVEKELKAVKDKGFIKIFGSKCKEYGYPIPTVCKVYGEEKEKEKEKEKEQQQEKETKNGVVVASENIYSFYENNFGTINPFMSETLGYWADDVGEELLLEAMKIALAQQKKFKYAEGVLKSWKNDGVKTVADIEKAKPKKKNDIDWDNL